MVASDDLFVLIKSLSKSEKRYFRLSSELHSGDKNYLKLFDAIDKQEVYDEVELKQMLKGEKFISRLSFEKVFLYNHILKSLRAYNSNTTAVNKLKAEIDYITLLFNKGLNEQAEKLLNRTKKKAERSEYFLPLLELQEIEYKLLSRKNHTLVPVKKMEVFLKHRLRTIDTYRNQQEYLVLYNQLERGSDSIKKSAFEDPLLSNESKAQSYLALYNFYLCQSSWFDMRRDTLKEVAYRMKMVLLMEQHPHSIELNPQTYIACLGNLANRQNRLEKFDDAYVTIQKLNAVSANYTRLPEGTRNRLFLIQNSVELTYYLNQGLFEEGLRIVKRVKAMFHLYENTFSASDYIFVNYQIGLIYFGLGKYALSLDYINNVLNRPNIDYRMETYSDAKIVGLLIHYELKHYELLEFQVKSTFRYLDKRNLLYKNVNLILNFIKKIIGKDLDQNEVRSEFVLMKKELELISKENKAKMFNNEFLLCWVQSKMEDKPFAELVKRSLKA